MKGWLEWFLEFSYVCCFFGGKKGRLSLLDLRILRLQDGMEHRVAEAAAAAGLNNEQERSRNGKEAVEAVGEVDLFRSFFRFIIVYYSFFLLRIIILIIFGFRKGLGLFFFLGF